MAHEQRKAMARLIARAWTDDQFKKRLDKNPKGALKEVGLVVPAGAKVHILHNTAKRVHVVIPTRPKSDLAQSALTALYTATDIKPHKKPHG